MLIYEKLVLSSQPPLSSHLLVFQGWPIVVAWISSDYFKLLLLPQLLRGENDLKQSDEFQAKLVEVQVYLISFYQGGTIVENFIELLVKMSRKWKEKIGSSLEHVWRE